MSGLNFILDIFFYSVLIIVLNTKGVSMKLKRCFEATEEARVLWKNIIVCRLLGQAQ
jgi:hypothetical protein